MKTATLIRGKVKFKAGQPYTFKHGDRINIVVTPNDGGDDIRVYDAPGSPIAFLQKGEEISLLFDGKDYLLLETADKLPTPTNGNGNGHKPKPTTQPAPTPTPPPVERHPALSPDVIEWCNIFEEVKAAMPDAQESTWRAAASTIYIQRFKVS